MNLSWVCNPKEFWCQQAEASEQVATLSSELYEVYHALRFNDEVVGGCV